MGCCAQKPPKAWLVVPGMREEALGRSCEIVFSLAQVGPRWQTVLGMHKLSSLQADFQLDLYRHCTASSLPPATSGTHLSPRTRPSAWQLAFRAHLHRACTAP